MSVNVTGIPEQVSVDVTPLIVRPQLPGPFPVAVNVSPITVSPNLRGPIPVAFNVSPIVVTPNLRGAIMVAHTVALSHDAKHVVVLFFSINIAVLVLLFLTLLATLLCPRNVLRIQQTS